MCVFLLSKLVDAAPAVPPMASILFHPAWMALSIRNSNLPVLTFTNFFVLCSGSDMGLLCSTNRWPRYTTVSTQSRLLLNGTSCKSYTTCISRLGRYWNRLFQELQARSRQSGSFFSLRSFESVIFLLLNDYFVRFIGTQIPSPGLTLMSHNAFSNLSH